MSVDDGRRRIGSDPFDVPADDRDAARRLRGGLVAPVTVWTAYDVTGRPTGLTVSSILVAEGDPAQVVGLLGPLSEFWEAVSGTKRFVVHVLGAEATRIADQFASRYPGDPFDGVASSESDWGPLLDSVGSRAGCALSGFMELGWSLLVRGEIDEVVLGEEDSAPLVHYRSRYLTTQPRSG